MKWMRVGQHLKKLCTGVCLLQVGGCAIDPDIGLGIILQLAAETSVFLLENLAVSLF